MFTLLSMFTEIHFRVAREQPNVTFARYRVMKFLCPYVQRSISIGSLQMGKNYATTPILRHDCLLISASSMYACCIRRVSNILLGQLRATIIYGYKF